MHISVIDNMLDRFRDMHLYKVLQSIRFRIRQSQLSTCVFCEVLRCLLSKPEYNFDERKVWVKVLREIPYGEDQGGDCLGFQTPPCTLLIRSYLTRLKMDLAIV